MTTAWDKLTPNQTEIRASHLAALRAALTAELTRRGLRAAVYTDSADNLSGKPIRAVYVQELRDILQNIKTVEYSDNPIEPNRTKVKMLHKEEIRTMVNVLEAAPKVGGTSTCNAGCTGLCVNCTGTCTGSCTSCTSCSGCTSCSSCSGGCTGCGSTCNMNCGVSCVGGCAGSCYNCCYSCSGYCASSCVVQCSSCVSSCSSSCWTGCNSNCTGTCHSGCQHVGKAMTNHKNPYK